MQENIKFIVTEIKTNEEKQKFITELNDRNETEKVVETYMTSSTVVKGETEETVQIIVPRDNFNGIINILPNYKHKT